MNCGRKKLKSWKVEAQYDKVICLPISIAVSVAAFKPLIFGLWVERLATVLPGYNQIYHFLKKIQQIFFSNFNPFLKTSYLTQGILIEEGGIVQLTSLY